MQLVMKLAGMLVGVVGAAAVVVTLEACSGRARDDNTSGDQRDHLSSAAAANGGGNDDDALLECKNLFRPFRSGYEGDDPAERAHPILGSLTNDDRAQAAIFDTEPPGARPGGVSCIDPRPLPAILRSETPRFDAYRFKNWTGKATCVSVYMETSAYRNDTGGARPAVYLGAFDPEDIAASYVAAGDGILVSHIQANVPASTEFTVVVFGEYTAARPQYALYVGGCGLKNSTADGGGSGADDGGASNGGGSSGKTW